MSISTMSSEKNVLPPLPEGHGFSEGDEVEIPVHRHGKIRGKIEQIDITYAGKRYSGLVVLGSDGRYYELDLHVAKKV